MTLLIRLKTFVLMLERIYISDCNEWRYVSVMLDIVVFV